MFSTLRTRLTVIFIGLAIVPLLMIAGVIAWRSFSTLEQEALATQEEEAFHRSAQVQSFFDDGRTSLEILIEVSHLETLTLEEQKVALRDFLSFEDGFSEFALFDHEQHEIIRLSRVEVFSDADLATGIDDENISRTYETKEDYYSPVEFDQVLHEPVMTLAIPITNLRTGQVAYVLIARMRVKPLWDLFASLDYVGNQDTYLIDTNGLVIAHRDPSVVLRETQLLHPENKVHATGLSGTDTIMALEKVIFGDQEFVVVAERPYSEAIALGLNLVATTIILTGITLFVAIGLVFLTVRQIVRPIEQLSKTATSIREGNLTVRAEVDGKDEIAQLASSFNGMAAQLEELIGSLEHRVAARTRDLEIAADVSRQVSRVLDMKQLLPYLANATRDGFNLSHVSIFLYDDTTGALALAAGSGTVGRKMLETGKHFNLNDKGLVPLAARTFEYQIINDVQASENHFVNPLLPDTRSETALPMRVGTRLIGVLDLQSDDVGRFNDEQVAVLTSLADQIAVAVQNAGLFTTLQAARAEAEQANIVKSQFLASMSHELRTPLNAVLNFTQFVSTGMLGEVNSEQVEMLDKVVESGKHLLSLINDVLDISKIEAGALKLFIESNIDMAKEAQTVIETAKGMLTDKSVQLLSDIESDLPFIVGDKRRIRQIMLNLVSNACKFTEEGEIRISLKQENDLIRFTVTDTGPGIAAEDQALVFETFRQTENGLRQGEGTGLGLPISRRLAETHGGKLYFDSTLNVGSTFYFVIPINNPELSALANRKEKSNVA